MKSTRRSDSFGDQQVQTLRRQDTSVSEWLADIERSVEDDRDDNRRKYTNIGGENGLELFV